MSVAKKVVVRGIEARTKLAKGAKFLGDSVKSTFGPFGQNWALEKGEKITNDGKTIAAELWLADEIEERGLRMARKAVVDTDAHVGDGSTTASILVSEVVQESIKQLPKTDVGVGKYTPAGLLQNLAIECGEIVEKLQAMATPITTAQQLTEVALVSSESEELANLIGPMQFELGKHGVILAEEVNEKQCSIERVNGIRIDNGAATPMVINNQEKGQLELTDVRVLLTNHTLTSLAPIEPLLGSLAKSGTRSVVLLARAFSEDAIKQCMEYMKAGFNLYPVNAPYTNQNEVMRDIAAVVGGRYLFTEETSLEDAQLSDIGFSEKIVARQYDATFAGKSDEQSKGRIEKRVKDIEDSLKAAESDFEKRNINERLAQLKYGFALLKVGSQTVTDRKRLKDKADDAVNAVRNALQEGVVPGAGQAFKDISDSLNDSYILKRPLLALYEQIKFSAPEGYEIPTWVKDSVKVLRVALQNSVSVGGNIATAVGATATELEKPRFVQEAPKE